VPATHKEGTLRLGNWITHLRVIEDSISAERKQRLNAIGFVWDVCQTQWEEGFAALTLFEAREGHCNVPNPHVEADFNLGSWVRNQRHKKDSMSADRRKRLDDIGFNWDPYKSDWEEAFAALAKFKECEGHCRLPHHLRLGRWVGTQRKNKDSMSADRRKRLDNIGFVWDPYESDWEEGFAVLNIFKAREGHCEVPARHVEGNFHLATWVSAQRTNRDSMSTDRRKRLDDIGFNWDPNQGRWEKWYDALTTFKVREGHCNVPVDHVEGMLNLGKWVGHQRSKQDTMLADRRKRLDDIGFVWKVQ
jgi:hypothetical protein